MPKTFKQSQFKKGQSGNPKGRPPGALRNAIATTAEKRLTFQQMRELGEIVVRGNFEDVERYSKDKTGSLTKYVFANAIVGAVKRKEVGTYKSILELILGRVAPSEPLPNLPDMGVKTFEEFCTAAGYPAPYPKQEEMRVFGIDTPGAHMLLGARGYGKTDYVVVLGTAYKIYLKNDFRVVIATKSKERNASMLNEIASACEFNGMVFEKKNSTCVRVQGLRGKDHSVGTVTIGSTSVRGRHPDLVIMDDPVTEEDVSEATRKKVQRMYNELSKLTANILIIGQPVHKHDLYQTLRPLLKLMEVAHGSIPELDHDLEAQRLAGVTEESIQASYFLKVISENWNPLENVQSIDAYPDGISVAFIDPSFKGGDFTALTIGRKYFEGIAVQGHVYKKAWNHCLDEIIVELKKRGVKKLAFECNSLGTMPLTVIKMALRKAGLHIGVTGIDNNFNKHARIMAAGAFAKLIHIAKTSDPVYVDQVVKYEYGVKNDDAPDSLASFLQWVGLIRGK